MSGIPDTFADNVLDFITGRAVSPSAARNAYLTLVTADPGATPTIASLAEVTTAGHARQLCAFSVPAGSPMLTSNTALITFGPYTADMLADVTHVVMVSALTGTAGDVMHIWELDASIRALNTQTLQLAVGTLQIGG